MLMIKRVKAMPKNMTKAQDDQASDLSCKETSLEVPSTTEMNKEEF